MLVPFEEYVERANRAQNVNNLVQIFLDTVQRHGLDRMIFCLLSDHKNINIEAGVGHLRNYPGDWMDFYFEKGFDRIDPVITYCNKQLGTFSWEEMQENMPLSKIQLNCLNMGQEAGLHNGMCTPLYGPQTFAGIGLASSEKKDSFDGNMDLITAYCNHFYLAFQRLHDDPNQKIRKNIYLTPKEKDVLTLASLGKTSSEISDILKISEDGVNFHLRNIYKKLQVNNRILAVVKAISSGLIHP